MKRNLYLNVQDKETALQNFLSAFEDISPKKEWIPVTESLGRITAGGILCPLFQPFL